MSGAERTTKINNALEDGEVSGAMFFAVSSRIEAVGELYVEMLIGAAEHYDRIACQWLNRSPRHVLLLHENDVAALFLPRLISEFRSRGWKTTRTDGVE